MTLELENFKRDIVALIAARRDDRGFDELLSALMSDINDLSTTRMDMQPILLRMLERLNIDPETGEPYDIRPFSPAYQLAGPIAMGQNEIAIFVEIMRKQVHVLTADGPDLDDLGRDYDFPRFQATRAIRIGQTWNTQMELADFPIGSRFATRDTGVSIIFEIFQSSSGNVLFRHVPDPNVEFTQGDVGNLYFGDLSPASPIGGVGRAAITGTFRPGQNRETDEAYRRRFLQFLRRRAFGGNVAQYVQVIESITGVGRVMVFPVWRGGGSVKFSIVDTNNNPVSPEFVEYVQELIDPAAQSGAGFEFSSSGIAPIAHRVTGSTPKRLDVDVYLPAVLVHSIQPGQAEQRFREIVEAYFAELRQSVIDEWERSYYNNDGISNAWVDVQSKVAEFKAWVNAWSAISENNRNILLDFAAMAGEWMPAEAVKQTHTWYTNIQPQEIGVLLLQTRLISAVGFQSILLNGVHYLDHWAVEQTQEKQWLPFLRNLDIEFVDYIDPGVIIPPSDIVVKHYITGYDRPISELSEVQGNG